jgi:predicted GIY-YIG superfamily endonuclease
MLFSCYIIYSKTLDRYYGGHTEDISVRLVQHNSGLSDFTARARDWTIVLTEEFETALLPIAGSRKLNARRAVNTSNG